MERILGRIFFDILYIEYDFREDTYEGNTCGQDSTQLFHYHPLPVAQQHPFVLQLQLLPLLLLLPQEWYSVY